MRDPMPVAFDTEVTVADEGEPEGELPEEQLEQVAGGVLYENGESKDKDMEPPIDILPETPDPSPPPPPSR